MDKHQLTISRCPCGDTRCSDYHLSIGKFCQGSGFDYETALRICQALAAQYPDRYQPAVVVPHA